MGKKKMTVEEKLASKASNLERRKKSQAALMRKKRSVSYPCPWKTAKE
jgi:hypothetical protein